MCWIKNSFLALAILGLWGFPHLGSTPTFHGRKRLQSYWSWPRLELTWWFPPNKMARVSALRLSGRIVWEVHLPVGNAKNDMPDLRWQRERFGTKGWVTHCYTLILVGFSSTCGTFVCHISAALHMLYMNLPDYNGNYMMCIVYRYMHIQYIYIDGYAHVYTYTYIYIYIIL